MTTMIHSIAARRAWTLALAVAGLFVAVDVQAKTLIKLTTLAPKDSSYDQTLRRMGQEWKKLSGGEVDLVVYAGGVQGGEAAMIKRMKIGQIQAAMLTAVGLSELESSVTGLNSMPMMFQNLDEVDYVGTKLQPRLEQLLAEKGFVVLFWTDAGWVQYFSRKPFRTPDDLRKLKMFSWAGSEKADGISKGAGFNPVPLETADIMPGLQTGLIDVVAMPPFYALGTQIYTAASYMLDLRWAPLVGAAILDKKTWDKLSPEVQKGIRESALQAGKAIKAASRTESDDAVRTMCDKWGLKVNKPTPDEYAQWRTAFEAVYPQIRGAIVPPDVWDMAIGAVKEYRAGATGSAKSN